MLKTKEWDKKCKNCGAECSYEINQYNCDVIIEGVECRICGELQ